MVSRRHVDIVKLLCKRLANKNIHWMIVGSTNLSLQGVEVVEHDIDIATDKEGAYAIEEELAEFLIEPVEYKEAAQFRSHFGKFLIDGIEVEVMGEFEILNPQTNRWEHVSDPTLATEIDFENTTIPVMELAHETKFYKIRGETEKLHAIILHLVEKYK